MIDEIIKGRRKAAGTALNLMVLMLILSPIASAALPVLLSDQGTDVKSIATGNLVNQGNLSIMIYDAPAGGSLLYNQTFYEAINNGSWNVVINNTLMADYGKTYYKDYEINGDDLDFDGQERLGFMSPLGELNITSNITLGQKIMFGLGQFIDNMVNGWLRLNGNVNVTENLEIGGSATIKGNLTIEGSTVSVNNVLVCLANGSNCQAAGNVTNNITQNITIINNITNNISYYYNVTNNITINITNNISYYYNTTNNITQNVTIINNITNNITQNITNNITQNVTIINNITNNITQNITYNITNNITINITNNITQNVTIINNITNNITQNITNNITNNITSNDGTGGWTNNSQNTTTLLNVSAPSFLGSLNWSWLLEIPGYVKDWLPDLQAVNDSMNIRLDGLNESKLNLSDQRYNETALIESVNTTSNIQSLGFNTTDQLNQLLVNRSDFEIQNTTIWNSLDLKLNATANACGAGNYSVFNGTGFECAVDQEGTGNVSGTGVSGYLAVFSNASSVNSSAVFQNGTNIGIGTTTPTDPLHVAGSSNLSGEVKLNDNNITSVQCITFSSGGMICSG